MIHSKCFLNLVTRLLLLAIAFQTRDASAKEPYPVKLGDHISIIGNTLADRMQHHGWLETYLHASHPEQKLVIRNLGFAADEITTRNRSDNFGTPDQWLTKNKTDVVFCFFGYNEALRGEAGLPQFEKDFGKMLDGMKSQKYNGKSAPRVVVFSPIAHENLHSPHLPDGTANNKNLSLYTKAMQTICSNKSVTFVDIFTPTKKLYATATKPLTLNGIHLLEHGNQALAQVIVTSLFDKEGRILQDEKQIQKLRAAVLDKNLHWFSRYRVVDGYNVFGGRSKLNWFGQSNADVMKREMEIFDVMTANRDQRIWAVARGSDLKVVDNNLPKELVVKSNKQGNLNDGKFSYLTGQQGIDKMKVAKGMKVNLFASEEMFPEIVNPVQMAVDTDGRLFVSTWPSYPHWNPTQPRTDRIVCLPDENGDGVADKCVVFADKLNSITGFEFWGGGMLVAAPPEIWFLKDTDGDDKADVKIRMLQGVSSADSHHTANAMVMGTDGALYWSRGIFNTASMETPTRTYRSKASGVHRFDPRTFEVSFHFPIGPNPHGNVIDQWGFQFANDGTGGTGSYVNIGKGIGNKKWFKKRVRPVAATGLLSSSHFPDANQGNFLICNCIGFLGVLQHEVKYNGADITATEIEPILVSSDPNFRPTDLEIGGDGALYVSDWSNALIGHMQHNIRDPNRDHQHGRIYRVTYEGRPLVKRIKLKGKPIETVLQAFYAKENSTRYRAKLELSGRKTKDVVATVTNWISKRKISNPDDAQALLECLWVFEEHRVVNLDLLSTLYQAKEPRVRAAAIRTLGHWGMKVKEWQPILIAAARDDSALVRAEAVKAAVSFEGLAAAEIIFEVENRKTDVELDVVLKYAKSQLNMTKIVQDIIKLGKPLTPATEAYVLRNASIDDLLKLKRTEKVYQTILNRKKVSVKSLRLSLDGLATLRKSNKLKLLFNLIEKEDSPAKGNLNSLGQLLLEQPATELQKELNRIENIAVKGKTAPARQLGYATWIVADGSVDDAFLSATQNKTRLRNFLDAVPSVSNVKLREMLYEKVRPLIFELPISMKAEVSRSDIQQQGIKVDYFYPSGKNVAIETLAKMKPKASGVVPEITMNVPQRKEKDKFALRFTGAIQITQAGKYTFFTTSDDGSRLYIGKNLVVNNDGLHGMVQKSGSINLSAGFHPIVVTYFDNGGGDGFHVRWKGPGMKKQKISTRRLKVTSANNETLHDIAIRTLATIPGHESEMFYDLASLVKSGKNRTSAIPVLLSIPAKHWNQKEVRPLVDNLIGYLSSIPAQYRTSGTAMEAIALAKSLTSKLPADQAKAIQNRLQNLNVQVIAIGTVPHRMIYDKELIAVQVGKTVEFRFSNTDNMPHNFSIVMPGSLEKIGLLAEATARDADAMARHYVPKSDQILLASHLLQPGQTQALSFEVPKTPGIYPYVCTYPGHWRRMYGALYVVKNRAEYQANPKAYLAANPLLIKDNLLKLSSRGREWTFAELISSVKPLPMGRSFDVGKELFKVSSCVSCHRLNNEGRVFGPDLTKLDKKKQTTDHLLRSLLEPSKDIDEKFQSYSFELITGKIVTGMILEETEDEVKIVVDPLAKSKPTIIKKADIEERVKSKLSMMPKGLLNKLSKEEILDLVAYIFAKGDKKHLLFKDHQMHHKH